MNNSGSTLSPKSGSAIRQMIGFRLGPENFAIDISKIHEIIKPLPITMVPNIPAGFSGVIQLRDQVIVIADLHQRFGFPFTEETKDTRIVVLEGSYRRIGILVDAVSEVVRFSAAMVEPSPGFHNGTPVDYIDGMGKLNGELLTLLNVDALFPDEMAEPATNQSDPATLSAEPTDKPAYRETPEAVDAMIDTNPEETKALMEKLGKEAETGTELYENLGELARYINVAHKHFAESMAQESNIKVKAQDLPTAYDLLNMVTEETEVATMKVMSHTEETGNSVTEMRSLLEQIEEAVPASSEAASKVSDLADRLRGELAAIEGLQDDTMMAMSFQDLTGQKIKQVIALMADVEERILKLVVQFGMERAAESEEAIEERIQDIDHDAVSQGDVDSILAEFGF